MVRTLIVTIKINFVLIANPQNPPNPRLNQVSHLDESEEHVPEDPTNQRTFHVNTVAQSNDQKYITFTSPNSDKEELRFLIDIRTSVYLIKHDGLNPKKTTLKIKDIVTLTGINRNMPITTFESAEIDLKLQDLIQVKYRIHVINSFKINIPFDGILGE